MTADILRSRKELRNQPIMHPDRDWYIGIGTSLLVFILVGVWSGYTYLSYQSLDVGYGADSTEQPIVYREALVEAALEYIEKRDAQFSALQIGATYVPPAVEQLGATTTDITTATTSEQGDRDEEVSVSEESVEEAVVGTTTVPANDEPTIPTPSPVNTI